MSGIALSAEQVFQIADPILTLSVLTDESTPSTKIDLKARLAIELNRKILESYGAERDDNRKKLKRLFMDQMSVKQEQELLAEISTEKRRLTPFLEIDNRNFINEQNEIIKLRKDAKKDYQLFLKSAKYKNGKKAKDRREALKIYLNDLNEKEISLKDRIYSNKSIINGENDERIISIDKLIDIENEKMGLANEDVLSHYVEYESDDSETDEIINHKTLVAEAQRIEDESELEIKKLKARRKQILKENAGKSLQLDDQRNKLGQEIINLTEEQKSLDDAAKVALLRKSDINPAAYEKSRAERIAEANTLFQKVINNNQDPHITFPFEKISEFNEINQLFTEVTTGRISNMVLIIYRSSELFGHWVGLSRSNDLRRITYFNSYGSYIDKALDYIPTKFADESRQNFPYLLKLLSESNYEIHWNSVQLQVMSKEIQTCGRWVGLWLAANKNGKTIEEFVSPFLSIPLEERDEIAVKLSDPYLS